MRQAQREIESLKKEMKYDIRFSELIIVSEAGRLGKNIIVKGSIFGQSSADYLKSLIKNRISPFFFVKYLVNIKPDLYGEPIPSEKEIRIGKVISEYYRIRFSVEVRGPMTIEEVEKESIEEILKSSRKDVPKVPFGFQNDRWKEFKDKYQDGDEIYYYMSEKNSWRILEGVAGYVLIRSESIIDIIVTSGN